MRYVIIALMAASLLVAAGGCVNVPPGPYVTLNGDGSGSGGGGTTDRKTIDRKAYDKVKDVLDDARDDNVITSNQYKELMKRAEKEFDAR